MLNELLSKVIDRKDLTETESANMISAILSGEVSPMIIAALISSLATKGETFAELAGAARAMRQKAHRLQVIAPVVVDTCGTGGDSSGTFNISTAAAFVVAGAGITVAKHGNRAVSSSCGSADVLEALGVDLSLPADRVAECVRSVGIGFLFAPMLHGAMKYAIGPRREMGIRTIFNILGPMTNPAGANVQLTGVFAGELTTILAEVLVRMGMKRTLVVWGEGNMDEMTITGTSHVADGHDGRVKNYTVEPEDVGLVRAELEDIRGGETAEESAAQVREVLCNTAGAKLDMVLLNAGAALMAAGRVDDLGAGVKMAKEITASGAALEKLDKLVAFSKG